MMYDLFAAHPFRAEDSRDAVAWGQQFDAATRVRLLAAARAEDQGTAIMQTARRLYQGLVSPRAQGASRPELTRGMRERMSELGLWAPSQPDLAALHRFSAFLRVTFTLARPYLSGDDAPFHINDNPIRKEKVFKTPMVPASAWKGNLRWTSTRLLEEEWHREMDVRRLAEGRLRLTLLFGDEKGDGADQPKGLARYLGDLSREADAIYRELLRERFPSAAADLPHHEGRLRFFPTFFDSVALEVINPHDRRTRAGRRPIYFESVPKGSQGIFSLLYVPFGRVRVEDAASDLQCAAAAISAMMLTYGFSAKKSSGFGEAEPRLTEGSIRSTAGEWPIRTLDRLVEEVSCVCWS